MAAIHGARAARYQKNQESQAEDFLPGCLSDRASDSVVTWLKKKHPRQAPAR
jgi:hypothetical protein